MHAFLNFQSKRARNDRQYSRAKTYGKYSLTMTIVNIIFTLCISLLITGLVVGCSYNYFRYGRYSYPGMYHSVQNLIIPYSL